MSQRKETRNVRRSMNLLDCAGYDCNRLAPGNGWNLLAIGKVDVVLVKVVGENWPHPEDRETLEAFPCPPNCRKLVHRWRKRERFPDILIL